MSSNGSIIMGEYKFIPKSNSKWDVKKATPGTKMYVAKDVSNGNKNKLIELIEAQGHSTEEININRLNKKNSSLNAQALANAQAAAQAASQANAAQANAAQANAAKRAAQANAAQANAAQANATKRAAQANAAKLVANAQTAQAQKNVAQNISAAPTRLTRTSSFSGLGSLFGKSANATTSSTKPKPISSWFTSKESAAKIAAKVPLANIQERLAQSHVKKIEYESKIANKAAKQKELTAKITSLETALTALRDQIKNHNVTANKAELNRLTKFITNTEAKLAVILNT